MFKKYLLILALTLIAGLAMASALSQTIEKAIQSAPDETAALQIIKKYVAETDDIEDLRVLQNYWLQIDEAACLAHFTTLKDKNPKDEKYIYLWARTIADTQEMMKQARILVKKYPAFEYGYRLLLAPYQKELFSIEVNDEVKTTAIYLGFKKDRKYFAKYLKKFPTSNDAIYLMIGLYIWEKQVDNANMLVAKAVTLNSSFLNWQFFTDFYLRTNQLQLLQAYVRRMIAESKQAEGMSLQEIESQFLITYLGTLFEAEYYTAFMDYIAMYPEAINDSNVQQMALLIYAHDGNNDDAFEIMDKMVDRPNDFYSWLTADKDLDVLRSDPRWTAKMNQMKQLWDAGRNGRKAAVVAKKINIPAQLWELPDKDGNIVKLADLKGSIVVLDFWATWCGPCKMAMPVIDEWMKIEMPAGVKVFSINVWERDPSLALPFMQENGYGMTLLYGTNDLSQKYGFDGIPYLCVIDKEGNIRFEEKGFAPELKENLAFWTEDLLK
jgi:thiol-disulfide isomerase/thioredoxin